MTENEIAKIIVDIAYHIHVRLGPGLLESVYEAVLSHELKKREISFSRQQTIPLIYDDLIVEDAFRADLIIEDKVIIEIKSLEQVNPVHYKQLLTYLKLTDKRLGLLINFGEKLIKNGIKRVVNGLESDESVPKE